MSGGHGLAMAPCAALVDELGQDGFADAFLRLMTQMAGAELCSAFALETSGELRCVLAVGEHPGIPSFARLASHRYASQYWQRDMVTRQALRSRQETNVHVARQAWNGITDPEYRRICYEAGDVSERVTIYRTWPSQVFASVYRTRQSGPFTEAAMQRLRDISPLVIALVARHDEMTRGQRSLPVLPTAEDMCEVFLNCGRGLSVREAEICARALVNQTQDAIADALRISSATVVTYRKRAYAKLGVANRTELREFCSVPRGQRPPQHRS